MSAFDHSCLIVAASLFAIYAAIMLFICFKAIRHLALSRRRAVAIKLLGNNGVNMQIKDNGSGTFSLQGQDAKGNPAPLAPGAQVSWAINDSTLANLTPSTDGLSCNVVAVGPLGKTQVTAAIAAQGDEPAMQAAGDLEIVAGDAVQVAMVGTQN